MGKQSKGAHAASDRPAWDVEDDNALHDAWNAESTFSGKLGVYVEVMKRALIDTDDDPWEQAFGAGVTGIFIAAQAEFARAEREYGRPIDIERDAKVIGANVSDTAWAVWDAAQCSMELQEPLDGASAAAEMRAAAGGDEDE